MKIPASQFNKLPRSFYLQPTLRVARELLGKLFVRRIGKKLLIGKIVETEAYKHNDPACHAFRGRTPRTEVMFWKGGHLYVYFTYGMHFCTCVVTDREGLGEAVLIRAVEPLVGLEVMMKNRFGSSVIPAKAGIQNLIRLTNGPAKFSKSFQLARRENGINLLESDIFIADAEPVSQFQIGVSSRIGIKVATEKKWRFFVKGNEWVSR